jgi:glycosyltransferase involved in cell wall biosynthesis
VTKVMHVISGLGTGGAESFLVALATQLKAHGVEQHIVSVKDGGANAVKLEAAGIPVTILWVSGLAAAAKAYGPLLDLVTREKPEVLQGWMYHGDLFATLMHSLARRSPRLFWNIRCSDMRLDDYSIQLKMVVRACAWASRRPDVVLANSRAGGDVHLKAGYRPRRLEIVPNGIDTARFKPDGTVRAGVRSELGLSPDIPLLFHVARVDPMKDHLTMLAAAEGLHAGKLVLVGRGTEKLSRPEGVIALGERSDVPRLLAAGDLVVSSSAYGEGFSNAIAEGMAAGLVPVATDIGDVREIIGITGEVVPMGNAGNLRRAIDRLLQLPAAERQAKGLAARDRIEKQFSLDRAVDRFAALYDGTTAA